MAKDNKVTHAAWVTNAITVMAANNKSYTGRDGKYHEASKGIHSLYTKIDGVGFWEIFRDEFALDKEQAKIALSQLVTDGVIVQQPARGGYMLYLAKDAPARATKDTTSARNKLKI